MHYSKKLAIALCLSWTAASQALAGTPAAPEPIVTPIMQQDLPDVPGKEALMLLVQYPPGAADPVHRHDAEALVYVLEGKIVMGVQGGQEQTLGPGQTFHEGMHDIHTVGRNASKTQPAKFLAILIKDKGKPALIPVH